MTNKELVELVSTIKERFNSLLKDVRAAVHVGAFQEMAKQHEDDILEMTELFAFQEFVRGLISDVEFTRRVGEGIMSNGSDYNDEATERLRERGYSLTKVENEEVEETEQEETNEVVVEAKEVDATCDEFLELDRLGEKEVESVQENVYYLFATALATLKRAIQADVYFERDDLERLTNDVSKCIDDAWKEREKTFVQCGTTECEMNKRHAIERLRRDDLTR